MGGETLTPNSNECNSTLTSGLPLPTVYIDEESGPCSKFEMIMADRATSFDRYCFFSSLIIFEQADGGISSRNQ